MECLTAVGMPGQFAVDVRTAPARATSLLGISMPAPSPIFMPLRLRFDGRHGRSVHQAQRVEPAVGQPGQRVGAAGHGGVETSQPNGVHRLADRNRARGAGGNNAGALPFQLMALSNHVTGRAGEVIPRVRWPGAFDAVGDRRKEIVFVRSRRLCPPRADADPPAIDALSSTPESAGPRRPRAAESISARPATTLQRREACIDVVHRHLAGDVAAEAADVKGRHRTDAAPTLEHRGPCGFARGAKRADETDPGNGHPVCQPRTSRGSRPGSEMALSSPANSCRTAAAIARSAAFPRYAVVNGRNWNGSDAALNAIQAIRRASGWLHGPNPIRLAM